MREVKRDDDDGGFNGVAIEFVCRMAVCNCCCYCRDHACGRDGVSGRMHRCKLGGEEVEDFVNCVIVAGEVDIDIQVAFVSGVGRVDAGDVVVFNEHRAVGGGGSWAGGVSGLWRSSLADGW